MLPFPCLSPEEAAALIPHESSVGFSGFTPAGAAKAIPRAIARIAADKHARNLPYQIGVITGASTGESLDGALSQTQAIAYRTPYQSNPHLRKQINSGLVRFFDLHLSMLPQNLRYGFYGPIHWAVIEASRLTADGALIPTASVGAAPTFATLAQNILVEINTFHGTNLEGFHDIYEPCDPPHRREIPIYKPSDRIGIPYIKIDPAKIRGIVFTNEPDENRSFKESSPDTDKIGSHVADFLAREIGRRRSHPCLPPIQSGVGNIANAVLRSLGLHPSIPNFEMYGEVIQDSVVDLMLSGKIRFASGTSLTVSPETLSNIYSNIEFFRSRMVLRPQEITNHPEIIRRLGLITINTALEVDLAGNVNSTHLLGTKIVNGIGGSGDYTRNGYLSIFTCLSTTKNGNISSIVPLVSHQDHNEHSVQVVATEQGLADLRGLDPHQRAHAIIENCAHPTFRPILRELVPPDLNGHEPQSLSDAFSLHLRYLQTGSMLADREPSPIVAGKSTPQLNANACD